MQLAIGEQNDTLSRQAKKRKRGEAFCGCQSRRLCFSETQDTCTVYDRRRKKESKSQSIEARKFHSRGGACAHSRCSRYPRSKSKVSKTRFERVKRARGLTSNCVASQQVHREFISDWRTITILRAWALYMLFEVCISLSFSFFFLFVFFFFFFFQTYEEK